jgi:hypothetical protein
LAIRNCPPSAGIEYQEVKNPCHLPGSIKKAEGIRTNVTLCFSASQALLAAKAGAYFISPFIGRLDDISQNGMELIRQIVTIYKNYNFETQVLVASVRHPLHVVEAAMIGADICTIPFKVIEQLIKHPQIHKLFQDAVDEVNAQLARYETIKRFTVLPVEFSQATGELTPTVFHISARAVACATAKPGGGLRRRR